MLSESLILLCEILGGAVIGTVLAWIFIGIIEFIDHIRWKHWFYGGKPGWWKKYPFFYQKL